MSLDAGTRLGPYEVLAPIGAGGMGEVYKARDTRLDRTVAIKVLPEHLAESPERKARFEREAKAISQLNHPNICTLHDIGEQDGIDFLVMEYIEGETLAERLKKGALKLDQALEYGIQIADGLDKAHRAGIVHRDLKPANIMITKSGVKLLDFGLAKLVDERIVSDGSDAPTQQKDLTAEQSFIGTLPYMAPEQLEGRPTSAATDVFAFGAVLYEMLTGRRAFQGESGPSIISAIMSAQPAPLSQQMPDAPRGLGRVLEACLEKSDLDRWQSAGDLKHALYWLTDGREQGLAATPASSRTFLAVVASLSFVAGVMMWMLASSTARTESKEVSWLSLGADHGSSVRLRTPPSFSRFGETIVFIGQDDQLYLKDINQPKPRALGPVDELARSPFLSPDGQWVAFVQGRELKKLYVVGGATSSVATLDVLARFGFWADDDIIYGGSPQGIVAVPASGGAVETVTTLGENELGHQRPFVVRDGLLFEANAAEARVAVLPSGEREHRYLTLGSSPWVSPTGHLLFRRGPVLWAAPFDEDTLQLTGDEKPVLEPVGQFGLTNDGTLLYGRGDRAGGRELVWVDRRGEIAPSSAHKDSFFYPRLFPDGHRVIVNVGNDAGTIWSLDLERGTRFLVADGGANHPVLSPTDDRLAYQSSLYDIIGSSSNGGESAALLSTRALESPHHWSPDGRFLAATTTAGQDKDIILIRDDGEVLPFLNSESDETAPRFSPDGRWLAYASDETGQWEIYVTDFPDSRRRYAISARGGREPLFSRDGRELFYRQGRRMMSVSIGVGPSLDAGRPVVLFEGDFGQAAASGSANYDVSADGERFLMIQGGPQAEDLWDINVVLNWAEELKRLVPTEN